MPKIRKPIPELDQSVVRPIAISIVQDVIIDRLGLPRDIQIVLPGQAEAVTQPTGFISRKQDGPQFGTNDRITIEISEKVIDQLANGNVVDHPEHIPIFLNTDLEVEMRPIYTSMEMEFTIKYRAKSRTEARRWFEHMKTKIPVKEDTWLHTLKYSYSIPEAFNVILKEIHRLTELNAPYSDDYETFFTKHAHPRFGILTDQSGKNSLKAISETQIRCLGYFDVGVEPNLGSKKDETDAWEVEFPYILRYEKPSSIYFSYPIVIHNTVLSDKFRDRVPFELLEDLNSSYSWSMHHIESFSQTKDLRRPFNGHPGKYFPLFDEFRPRTVPQYTMRIFTALVLLAKETDPDPLLLMNILDLESDQFGMKFSPWIIEFMKSERDFMTKHRESVLHLTLYENRIPVSGDRITIDEDLNIRSTKPLNPRKYYHLRLSAFTDYSVLTEEAIKRLLPHKEVFQSLVDYVLPEGYLYQEPKLLYHEMDPIWISHFINNMHQISGSLYNTPPPQNTTISPPNHYTGPSPGNYYIVGGGKKDDDKVIIPPHLNPGIPGTIPQSIRQSPMKTVQFFSLNGIYSMNKVRGI